MDELVAKLAYIPSIQKVYKRNSNIILILSPQAERQDYLHIWEIERSSVGLSFFIAHSENDYSQYECLFKRENP